MTDREVTDFKSAKINPLIQEMNSIQNELLRLDLPKNEHMELRIQKQNENKIGGRYHRRNRIPNIFNQAEEYSYIFQEGRVVGVRYQQEEDFNDLVMGIASKSKRKLKLKRSKSKFAIYEDEEENEDEDKDEYKDEDKPKTKTKPKPKPKAKIKTEMISGIKTEIVSRTQKKATYVLHLKPNQKRAMVVNKSQMILIEPRTNLKNILEVSIYRPKRDKTSSYTIGINEQIKVKHDYTYSIHNLNQKSKLRVTMVLFNEPDIYVV